MLSEQQTQTLEQLSAAATQGEWVVEIDTRTEVCRVTQDELSYTAGYNISADSEVIGCEGIIPGPNAEYDAAFICQLVNLYRTGQLVEVQLDDATVERMQEAYATFGQTGHLRTTPPSRECILAMIAAMKGPKP